MKMIALALIGCLLLFSSCKKEDPTNFKFTEFHYSKPSQQEKSSDYVLFKKGSYWIYDHYLVDSNGTETLQSQIKDSAFVDENFISGDTVYSTFRYSPQDISNPSVEYLAEYENQILNEKQIVVFSILRLEDTVSITNHNIRNDPEGMVCYDVMKKPTEKITVPAGNFSVVNVETSHIVNYIPEFKKNPVIKHKYYSKNVGVVLSTYAFLTQSYEKSHYERRLVRYRVRQ